MSLLGFRLGLFVLAIRLGDLIDGYLDFYRCVYLLLLCVYVCLDAVCWVVYSVR